MYTKEEMKQARITELQPYLLNNHADLFTLEGDSLRMKNNHSLSIKKGYCGYTDFGTDEHGNSVDFLINHLNYSVESAVLALSGQQNNAFVIPAKIQSDETSDMNSQEKQEADLSKKIPVFPEPVKGPFRNLFAYLTNRGISNETIQALVDKGLLYQYQEQDNDGKTYINIAFVNEPRDWGERHGTLTFGNSFHGIFKNSRSDGFWSFRNCENSEEVKVAYICESAIDAISLFELQRLKGHPSKYSNSIYVSIGGASKQAAITRVKKYRKIIIAVDNDEAGADCRKRNIATESIIPTFKDWNEDLLALLNSKEKPVNENHLDVKVEDSVKCESELKRITDEAIAEGLFPVGWTDPFNNVEHAKYMIEMTKMRMATH